jgi:hypothetical protein
VDVDVEGGVDVAIVVNGDVDSGAHAGVDVGVNVDLLALPASVC